MNGINSTQPQTLLVAKKDGYGLQVYGLANDQFFNIHAPALTVIFVSLISVIIVLICSFKHQHASKFFKWSKPERFVVYLALCDGLFNVCHAMDHLHIMIVKNHVYPKGLCVFYGFMLAEFMTAQHLLVNLISINAFVLIYYQINIEFGTCDWKLLTYVFGVPCVAAIAAASADVLGPNGAFCYFDGVKGDTANLFFTTIPLALIIVVDIIFYILTWWQIRKVEPKFQDKHRVTTTGIRASSRAAKNMSLFVVAFVIQWWVLAFYGVWQKIDDVPQAVFQLVTIFVNTGGILNGIVYIIIRHRKVTGLIRSSLNSNSQQGSSIVKTASTAI